MMLLSLDGIELSRNSIPLVKNLGITLFSGSCLLIRGKNGSGKTTLLDCIAGIRSSDNGGIICDVDFRSVHVGHKNGLTPSLTVYENLEYWASINKMLEVLPIVGRILGVDEYFYIKVENLSQGWQRKVALTRLLLSQANMWCLDEPYANLDSQSSEVLNNMIRSKCSQGGIVIIASHEESSGIEECLTLDIEDFWG